MRVLYLAVSPDGQTIVTGEWAGRPEVPPGGGWRLHMALIFHAPDRSCYMPAAPHPPLRSGLSPACPLPLPRRGRRDAPLLERVPWSQGAGQRQRQRHGLHDAHADTLSALCTTCAQHAGSMPAGCLGPPAAAPARLAAGGAAAAAAAPVGPPLPRGGAQTAQCGTITAAAAFPAN